MIEALHLRDFGDKILADLILDWWVLLLALVLACVISFVWIVLLRFAAAFVIYTTIIVSLLLMLGINGFCFYKYFTTLEEDGMDDIFKAPGVDQIVNHYFDHNTWLTIGCILAVINLIILIVLLFLSKRIAIAVKLLEEASRAVGHAMTTLFFPIVPFFWQSIVLVWFLVVASCLATAGEKEFQVILNFKINKLYNNIRLWMLARQKPASTPEASQTLQSLRLGMSVILQLSSSAPPVLTLSVCSTSLAQAHSTPGYNWSTLLGSSGFSSSLGHWEKW